MADDAKEELTKNQEETATDVETPEETEKADEEPTDTATKHETEVTDVSVFHSYCYVFVRNF